MNETKASLLIVDDDPVVRISLSQLLAEIGYRVRTAEDGSDGLVEIGKQIPDILLSDLNMPRMSGFELLSAVRRQFPSIRTIAMSGMFQGDEVPSGVAADAFFQKGSSVGSLLRVVENLPVNARRVAGHGREFATG
jgi:CheY-like chemotaxis protein